MGKHFFSLFLSLSLFVCVAQSDVVFNTSALCMQNEDSERICYFSDNSIWNGGKLPMETDQVLIQSDDAVTIVLDTNQNMYGLTIQGNVEFLVGNSSIIVSYSFFWYSPSIVVFDNSTCNTQVLRGASLYLNESSITATVSSTLSYAQLNQSSFTCGNSNISTISVSGEESSLIGHIFVGSLYSYGSVSFCDSSYCKFASSLSIYNYAMFDGNEDLHLSSLTTLSPQATVYFSDCQTTINTIVLSLNSNLTLSGSEEAILTHTLSSVNCKSGTNCYIIMENVNVIFTANAYITPVLGENVNITVSSTVTLVGIIQTTENPVTINTYEMLRLSSSQAIAANINVMGSYGVLYILGSTVTLEPCSIQGTGKILIVTTSGDTASLICEGTINVANVELQSSNLTVEEISVTQQLLISHSIFGQGAVYINGNVNAKNVFFTGNTLAIVGDFEQADGLLGVTLSEMEAEPVFTVDGEMKISGVSLQVSIEDKFEGKLLLAECTKEIVGNYDSAEDLKDPKHEIEAHVSEKSGKIYVQNREEGDIEWLQRNWIYFIVFASLILGLAVAMGCGIRKVAGIKNLPSPGDTIPPYISSLSISRLDCCDAFMFVVFYFFVWIAVFEGALLTISLALLIPFGFIFGIIEHKTVHFWTFIVLLVQIGGLLDIFADLLLMAKVSVYFFDAYVLHSSDSEMDNLEGQELQLFFARLVLTIFSAFLGTQLIFTLLSRNGLGKKLDIMSGKSFFAGSGKGMKMRASSPIGILLQLLFAVIFWKVLMLGLRIYLLCIVLRALIVKGKLGESAQHKVQWLECILYLDLMWSGLPLGILTFLEMFYFSEDFEFGKEQVFELMKLGALAVDLIGASFLFYYIICGLIKKIPVLHHHKHHDHAEEHGHAKEPLLGHLQE